MTLTAVVLSVYVFFQMGMAPVGSFQAGFVAQYIGAPWAIRIAAMVCAVVALMLSPRLIRSDA